jgi:HemY protein
MRRIVLLLLLVVAAMALAVWLGTTPGRATLEIAGWRVDSSFGALALLGGAGLIVAILIDRVWRWIAGAPGRFALWRRARREKNGYAALTRGLVAVAAGDPKSALREAALADRLLGAPPASLLLSAQAAQLAGDEAGARKHLEAMRAAPETEFAALRGLVALAMRESRDAEALDLARRAREIRPDATWVAGALVELETKGGHWIDAERTIDTARRAKLLPAPEADVKRAAVLHEAARLHEAKGDRREAIRAAERAFKLAPDRPEIAVELALLYARDGKARAAGALVEKEWARRPHPALIDAYRRARPVAGALQWIKQVERLAKLAPTHAYSHVAMAEASLAAELWGEAKRHAEAAIAAEGGEARAGLCRLMARIAEQAGDEASEAKAWLARASDAPADPAWTCQSCGHPHAAWHALCARCGAFDKLAWAPPARLAPALQVIEGDKA